jgi:hypothetical protein
VASATQNPSPDNLTGLDVAADLLLRVAGPNSLCRRVRLQQLLSLCWNAQWLLSPVQLLCEVCSRKCEIESLTGMSPLWSSCLGVEQVTPYQASVVLCDHL